MPGEEAIFIHNGNMEETFSSGTYKLSTENYPFISRLRNAFSGGVSTFSCVVYFVRTAATVEILWGTKSPIQVRDPKLMIATSLRAFGSYKVRVDNPGLLLTQLLGNNISFLTQQELDNYFASELQQHVFVCIAQAVENSGREILGINARQAALAQAITPMLNETVLRYGLRLVTFTISSISIPEDDPNRQQLEKAYSDLGTLNILGESWNRIKGAEILSDLANNPGAGGMAAAGAGMGMGMAAGGAFATMAQQVFSPLSTAPQQPAVAVAPAGRFTQKGTAAAPENPPKEDPLETLLRLQKLLDAGVITQSDYDAKKVEILNRM